MNTSAPKPARNPWPIAIIAYFVFFIAFIISFIIFAMGQKVELVNQNYYEDEIQFQQQIDRNARTQPLGKQVAVAYDAGKRQINITLPAAHQQAVGSIRLYRPSDSAADQKIKLAIGPDSTQAVDAKKLGAGLWKIRVQWTVDGQEYSVDKSIVVGSASQS